MDLPDRFTIEEHARQLQQEEMARIAALAAGAMRRLIMNARSAIGNWNAANRNAVHPRDAHDSARHGPKGDHMTQSQLDDRPSWR